MVFLACSVRTGLFMRSDGCGILLTNVGNSLITCPRRWTPDNRILMEHCSSALHLQKSCSNRSQTHRGNAIVETPCWSPADFAILLPNNSILVVDPKCSKAYIIQLKACIKQDLRTWQPRHWVHASPEFILNASFQKGAPSMKRENWSLHDVWWLWHTLDKCRELFNHMLKQMDTP